MRVLVVGGGNVGIFVATELREGGHEVVLMEIDPERVELMQKANEPIGVVWVIGDGCEVSELAQAEPDKAEVVIAVTGDDEDNLVISLLAKQEFGAPTVIARVNNPKNEWLFNDSWGVDLAVSTPHLLAGLVEEAVSVGTLVRLLSFEHGQAQLVEVTLAGDSPAIGKQIQDMGFPRDSTVVAIVRHEHVVVPRGDTEFLERDEVIALVTHDSEEEVCRLLIGDIAHDEEMPRARRVVLDEKGQFYKRPTTWAT